MSDSRDRGDDFDEAVDDLELDLDARGEGVADAPDAGPMRPARIDRRAAPRHPARLVLGFAVVEDGEQLRVKTIDVSAAGVLVADAAETFSPDSVYRVTVILQTEENALYFGHRIRPHLPDAWLQPHAFELELKCLRVHADGAVALQLLDLRALGSFQGAVDE